MLGARLLLIGLYAADSLNAHALPPDNTVSAVRPALPLPADGQEPTRSFGEPESLFEGPTLENARWVGFTPAVFTGTDLQPGVWILGPFDRKERTGWVTDVSTGATTRIRFRWRAYDGGRRTALLSRQAAAELGLKEGNLTSLAVYLPR